MTTAEIREEILGLRDRVARLEARLEAEAPHDQQRAADLRELRDALIEARGSARVIALAASVGGGLAGAGIGALASWLLG